MATLASLEVLLRLNDQFSKPLEGTASKLDAWGAKLRSAGQSLSLFVTAPIVGAAVVAVNAASDLAEAQSAVTTVYGESADAVLGYSESVAGSLGLSRQEALATATVFGAMGAQIGLTGNDLADFSNDMLQAGADLASFYNAPVPEALAAIQSGLQGESEPLRQFGIFLSDAALNQYALAKGIGKTTQQMTEQEKIALRQAFIMDHLGAAAGDFERTQGGLANSTRILRAQLTDLAATFGQLLLPYVQKAVGFLQKLAKRIGELSPQTRKLVAVLLLVAAALGPVLLAIGTMLPALSALGAGFAFLLGPIGLVIAAFAGLAFAFSKNWLGIRDKTVALGKSIGNFATDIIDNFKAIRSGGIEPIAAAFGAVGIAIDDLLGTDVEGFFVSVGTAIGTFVQEVAGFYQALRAEGLSPIEAAFTAVGNAIDRLLGIDVSPWFYTLGQAVAAAWILLQFTVGALADFAEKAYVVLALSLPFWFHDLGVALGVVWFLLVMNADLLADVYGAAQVLIAIGLPAWFDELAESLAVVQLALAFVVGWFAELPGRIVEAVGDLASLLTPAGFDLVFGFLEGIADVWNNQVVPALMATGANAVLAVGDLAATLWQAGNDLIFGLGAGATDFWNNGVVPFLAGIPGLIVATVGYLGNLLYQAGADALQGLVDGAASKLDDLQNVLDAAVALFNAIVNLGHSPWPMMIGAGEDAMAGLAIGVNRGLGDVRAAVGSAIGTFGIPSSSGGRGTALVPALARVGGAGGTVVVQHVHMEGAIVGEEAERWAARSALQHGGPALARAIRDQRRALGGAAKPRRVVRAG